MKNVNLRISLAAFPLLAGAGDSVLDSVPLVVGHPALAAVKNPRDPGGKHPENSGRTSCAPVEPAGVALPAGD